MLSYCGAKLYFSIRIYITDRHKMVWWKKQVPPGTPVVNALSKQRAMLENILRACVGLAPENNMILEYK